MAKPRKAVMPPAASIPQWYTFIRVRLPINKQDVFMANFLANEKKTRPPDDIVDKIQTVNNLRRDFHKASDLGRAGDGKCASIRKTLTPLEDEIDNWIATTYG